MRQRDALVAHNERVKLAATTINAVGLAFIALGIVRTVVAPDVPIDTTGVLFAIVGLACHATAHYILTKLEVET